MKTTMDGQNHSNKLDEANEHQLGEKLSSGDIPEHSSPWRKSRAALGAAGDRAVRMQDRAELAE